jgi:NACHT domain
VYWLSGLAGIGKSTIAKTVAERAEEKGLLGASFFFSRSDKPLWDPGLVLPTLAFQLAYSGSAFKEVFKEVILAALRRDPTVPQKDLFFQLKELILNPLLNIDPPPHPVLIILDALDECEEKGAAKILPLVFKHLTGIPFLRILITSRPEPHLSSVFNEASNLTKTVLHDIEASVIRQDIRLYISTELARISQKFNLAVPANWPTDAERNSLIEKCGKLFVYAATAIRFIGHDRARDPPRYLRLILDTGSLRKAHMTPYSHLDSLYMEVLRNSLPPYNDGEILTRFQTVVGSIVLLREPLPLHSLAHFVQYESRIVEACLSHLHSVIVPPSNVHETPCICHPSFLEFITDPSRCSMPEFVIVPKPEQELRHAIRCFELMGTHLKRDVAGISDPSLLNEQVDGFAEKVREALLPDVQYACRYWASHLLCLDFGERRLMEELEGFAKRSILWWFEAMSLLGSVSNAVRSIEEAHHWAVCVFPIDP